MNHRNRVLAAASIVLLTIWSPLAAQEEDAPDVLEAGGRVARIALTSSQLSVARQDSLTFSGSFYDSDGNRVSGVRWGIFSNSAISGLQSIKDSIPDTYLFWGEAPGTDMMAIVVRSPAPTGGGTWRLIDSIPVTVRDWPVASVVIEDPQFAPIVGTSYKLEGTILTTRGDTHATASLTWRSGDRAVASVTAGGVVTFVGTGDVRITATSSVDGVAGTRDFNVEANPVRQLTLSPQTIRTRTGDVEHLEISALDARGRAVDNLALSFSVFGLDSAGAEIFDDGTFVAENPGSYRVIVTAGNIAAQAVVEVEARAPATNVQLVGRGPRAAVATSDLWIFEGNNGRDYAYTGTHANGGGQRMFVWDVTDPSAPDLVDSVVVDARVVNDVKVNGDASWAIITREGASGRANGIVVLSLDDPAHPEVIAELTNNLTGGIHNVWINGDVVYTVNDGTSAMDVIDMSDPYNPTYYGRWELRPGDTNKSLHDVWADGRYAYVSYWDDGLVILDVGAGTHGGTALEPQFVSRVSYDMGNTHTAWREGDYVFVGDELPGPSGYIHVFDVSDIENPAEVAKYDVPEAGAHNIWVENGTLYVAYYNGGLRIVDVTGELRGDLYRQGREIGRFSTSGAEGEAIQPNSPMAWGPQPYKGNIFLTDMNSGLWVVKHDRPVEMSP